jgi:hypothetical protein
LGGVGGYEICASAGFEAGGGGEGEREGGREVRVE